MAAIWGFLTGFSLILAIGAQNAFVLKQGLRRRHVFLVCAICALSDALLIVAGVAGFGGLAAAFPGLVTVARYGGAAFLFAYAARSWHQALSARALNPAGEELESAKKTALYCLMFTWLNPHVYLDTVALIGAISTQYGDAAWQFGAGAAGASFAFFFALGYGARLLAPLFRQPAAWRVLDAVIGLVMFGIAASLLAG